MTTHGAIRQTANAGSAKY